MTYSLYSVSERSPEELAFVSGYYVTISPQTCFADGSANTFGDFLYNIVLNPQSKFHLIVDEDAQPIGHILLNDFKGFTAFAHFGLNDKAKNYRTIAKDITKQLFQGYETIECFMGLTPVTCRGAIAFARIVGAKIITTIPEVCWDAETGRYVDGIATQLTRKDYGK